MIDLNARLFIDKLTSRGDGMAKGPVFVPFALPGEEVLAEVDGERGRLVEVLKPSADRVAAPCPHFSACGGCAVQTLAPDAYAEWKRSLVVDALRHAGLAAEVAPLRAAWGAGRRRATFHARFDFRGRARVGFMEARSHKIFELDACPILAPDMAGAVAAAREIAEKLAGTEKPLDIVVTGSRTGLDVDVRGCGKLDFDTEQALIAAAQKLDLARISNHGIVLIERRAPEIVSGRAVVTPPPGGFLQATAAGEEVLTSVVVDALSGAKKCADLFSGSGAFALRLAEQAEVFCVESDAAALNACLRAAHNTQNLRGVKGEVRDLFVRPLLPAELEKFDALVFDPPRAGAEAQARELARSSIPKIAAVSCNAQTFARDAKILVAGGYALDRVIPVDQFLYSPHVEVIGIFAKALRAKKKRRLLG
ncbi:23S rRNA (uracil1939-C5)-methyltransferase [Rhodoblastus acidophilus]|uniref:class I SAM-dependent RNA methyltransferase n=1 Tax=Rhodoblastus acidophilus TaxID=1074 RepID=UPI0022249D60|nr:class I SAM-dependent RNA methyltransferase [Rhodoblastus acidophilus]MCW2285650.1 23S rRNA (uracil1939-C5)-methyltransferase [Rhodoblastus acidophilus]MCW2334592.1 23S rRNA (uracil1939-C5)-methyltransferase [Rhodoblastus acidophilus]